METRERAAQSAVRDRKVQEERAEGKEAGQDAVGVLAQALHPQSCVCAES